MVANAAGRAAAKFAAKTAAKQVAGSALPGAGNVAMGLWSLYDAVKTIDDVDEIKKVATAALEKLELLKSKLKDLQRIARDFKDFDKLAPDAQMAKAQELASEGQDMLATLNDCTRARKCHLVSYKSQRGTPPDTPAKLESAKGGGCCNGQTGHHLIPEKSLEGACGNNYNHNLAPTVCAEGTSQGHGSHKRVHEALAQQHALLAGNGDVDANGRMSMDDALNAGTASHKKAFPLSNCSSDCIRAQLAAYYKVCGTGRPLMVNAQSKVPKKLPAAVQPQNGP